MRNKNPCRTITSPPPYPYPAPDTGCRPLHSLTSTWKTRVRYPFLDLPANNTLQAAKPSSFLSACSFLPLAYFPLPTSSLPCQTLNGWNSSRFQPESGAIPLGKPRKTGTAGRRRQRTCPLPRSSQHRTSAKILFRLQDISLLHMWPLKSRSCTPCIMHSTAIVSVISSACLTGILIILSPISYQNDS